LRRTAIILSILSCLWLSSCLAGPHQLRRTVDDWDHKVYVKQPWVDVALWVVGVFPLLNAGAMIGDIVITDAYAFWAKDAWDGKGTGYRHFDVQLTKGAMNSLLMDDGKFLEIK
jgi:hypothetical protein